jgi:uridine kinase
MSILENGLAAEALEIRVKGYGAYQAEYGTSVAELVSRLENVPHKVVGVIKDNELKDLHHILDRSCSLELVDVSVEMGMRIYRRTGIFVMIKACRELFPERKLIIKHSLSNGLFCEFLDHETNAKEVEDIERHMKAIVARDFPINRIRMTKEAANVIFRQQLQPEKIKLFSYWDHEEVILHEIDGLYDYFYGHLLPNTGSLEQFKVHDYPPGLILQTLEPDSPDQILPWVELPKLFTIYDEAKDWADMLDTQNVSNLNTIIESGKIADLIRINEALHEKKIAWIADQICSNPRLRLILIAGPSSSGKTTFAQRLLIQLRVNGRRPVSISMDNYFVNRDSTPRDANGEFDFENINALKIDLFNDHLNRLIAGEEVEMPIYNFKHGCCEPDGEFIQVPHKELIIIEGIHGLNEELTWRIPRIQKYKIYVSALTQLNIDNVNRVPTTDARLVRRILRDGRTRSHGSRQTIERWPSVRRGEDNNIFPYQENADVMFNSALVYELAVLKDQIEPELAAIGPEHPEHIHARRILGGFKYFKSVPPELVPQNSILREFMGESCFKV